VAEGQVRRAANAATSHLSQLSPEFASRMDSLP
jgi:hypothetical protein